MPAFISEIDNRTILSYETEDGSTYLLSSMYSTARYQAMWAAPLHKAFRNQLFIIFGLGDTSFIRELVAQNDDTARFLVYEPSEEIYALAQEYFDLASLPNRVKVICESNADALKNIYNSNISYFNFKGAAFGVYPNYLQIFPEEYEFYSQIVSTAISSTRFSASTVFNNGRSVITNSLKNARVLAHSAALPAIRDCIPKDLPVIICGAGPSLNDALPHLSAVKGRALILCVDSALPALLKRDIIPDLIVSVDPVKERYNFTDSRYLDIPGAFPISARDFIFEGRTAPNFFYNNTGSICNIFSEAFNIEIPSIRADSSVGNHAYALTEYIGSEVVILTGLDMGYTPDHTHAEGTLLEAERADEHKGLTEIPGVNGVVYADEPMILYRTLLEQNIELDTNTTVINASTCGALIKGCVNMPIAEAIDRYCTRYNPADFGRYEPLNIDIKPIMDTLIDVQTEYIDQTKKVLSSINSLLNTDISRLDLTPVLQACDMCILSLSSHPALFPLFYSSLVECKEVLANVFDNDDQREALITYRTVLQSFIKGYEFVVELERL